jgi:Fungal protein kinase
MISLGHRWLYRVMGILHRDINMGNIMIRRNGAKVVGVLIDYDLAVDISKPSSTSLERTGVRRFMAIDLLEPTSMSHHARHDMEAMHWVLVWFSFRYEDGDEIHAAPLETWIDCSKATLMALKTSFLLRQIEGRPTPPFSSLSKSWILPWNRLFGRGHSELGSYNNERSCSYDAGTKTQVPDEIVFPRDAVFHDDTSMWTAFWNVLNPDKHVDFDDVSNSVRSGFLPY